MADPRFKVWKTVSLGGHVTIDDLRSALKRAECYMANGAEDILISDVVYVSDQNHTIDLVITSPQKLGFRKLATYEEICMRARARGLDLCPPEVGPQLRLQHLEQPFTEWLYIGMEPLIDPSGRPVIFSVDSSFGAHYLGIRCVAPDKSWIYNGQLVFAMHNSETTVAHQ